MILKYIYLSIKLCFEKITLLKKKLLAQVQQVLALLLLSSPPQKPKLSFLSWQLVSSRSPPPPCWEPPQQLPSALSSLEQLSYLQCLSSWILLRQPSLALFL